MTEPGNAGISDVSSITAENIAVGDHARIEQVHWGAEATRPLADLRKAVEQFDGPPDVRDALTSTHRELVDRLEQPSPDRSGVLSALRALRDLAGPASAVTQAVGALAQVLALVL